MPRFRKTHPDGVGEGDARISILLPKQIDRQLRALAASRGSAVSPIIREWIVEKLREVDPDGHAPRSSR